MSFDPAIVERARAVNMLVVTERHGLSWQSGDGNISGPVRIAAAVAGSTSIPTRESSSVAAVRQAAAVRSI
jgi:hypothetical protein